MIKHYCFKFVFLIKKIINNHFISVHKMSYFTPTFSLVLVNCVNIDYYAFNQTQYTKKYTLKESRFDFILKSVAGSCLTQPALTPRRRAGGKKRKKRRKKKAYLRGLRGGFGQSFPTVPTRGSSGGVEGESSSPVINAGLISRLLIKCFFQCV